MIRAGITSANINKSKYLFTIDNGSDDDVVLAALWILNPKINDDVPVNKETSVRTFCVIAGTITIGEPRFVFGYCCCNM
jgi:hypothetical protein